MVGASSMRERYPRLTPHGVMPVTKCRFFWVFEGGRSGLFGSPVGGAKKPLQMTESALY